MLWSNRGLLIAIALLFLGCDRSAPPPVSFTQNVLTIDYHILIGHPLNEEQKQRVQQILDATFSEIDAIYNKWNPRSEISQLNQLQKGEKKALSPQLYSLFLRMDRLVALTQGWFDPTIEAAQNLWKEKLTQGKVPTQEEIDQIRPCVGWQKIHFANGLFYKDHSSLQLDLGGAAKGLCVDLLIERLNQAGFKNVFVEWGGEVRATGLHPAQRPWRIYISRFEDLNPTHAIACVDLKDQAIATSGSYFQSWTIQSTTYCHIFNPQTLSPITVTPETIASASLMADDCFTADSLAKVLLLFSSLEEAKKWLISIQEDVPVLNAWLAMRSSAPYTEH